MRTTERALSLVNAHGRGAAVRVEGSRIVQLDGVSRAGDLRVDLGGDRLLPGLINAHDHLQLNALPRLKYRDRYASAAEWIADIGPRLKVDPIFVANGAVPRDQRLLIGGVKNLLSGVTTVAHHDPAHASLLDERFPVRVPRNQGWSHSLTLDGVEAVQRSFRRTPSHWPWIIHAAEGFDEAARTEFDQLDALGCLHANTVLVHGVALGPAQHRRMIAIGAALVWCPTSNLHLFDRTPDIRVLFDARRLALGSDSRISGQRDLLAELRVASEVSTLDDGELESLVTDRAAEVLRVPDRGLLARGALADLVVLPAGLPLSRAVRADLRLVLVGGVPRYADPDLAQALGEHADLVEVRVDGRRKFLARSVVDALREARVHEAGLDTLSEKTA